MYIKDKEAIKQLEKGGKILGKILNKLSKMCKPGVTTWDIDIAAEKMIFAAGGRPAFKGYRTNPNEKPFPSTICASINEQLVHAYAKKSVKLKDGDIFSIDIGMEYPYKRNYRGFYTDTALTVAVGYVEPKAIKLMDVTQKSLEAGIKAAKAGNSVADIGIAVENYVKSQGKYGIIRDLVGHGVGYEVHEEPRIPNYNDRSMSNFVLKEDMVIAIEPMVSLGSWKIKTASDGWTIKTADDSLSAHFEHTIIVKRNGCKVITRRPKEK